MCYNLWLLFQFAKIIVSLIWSDSLITHFQSNQTQMYERQTMSFQYYKYRRHKEVIKLKWTMIPGRHLGFQEERQSSVYESVRKKEVFAFSCPTTETILCKSATIKREYFCLQKKRKKCNGQNIVLILQCLDKRHWIAQEYIINIAK